MDKADKRIIFNYTADVRRVVRDLTALGETVKDLNIQRALRAACEDLDYGAADVDDTVSRI